MSDNLPSDPLDDRSRRRTDDYRKGSELDDQWGVADDEDIADDGVEIEELAGQYLWEEPPLRRRRGDEPEDDLPDLGPLPKSAKRLKQRRTDLPRETRIQHRYDRAQAYANSPSFRKSKLGRFERAFSRLTGDDALQKGKRDPNFTPGPASHLPFWGILILVVLALVAVLVVLLACASLVALLN